MNKLKVKQSVVINLPIEEIFAYVSDLEKQVDWTGVTTAVSKISPETPRVGAKVRSTIWFLGRWFDITFEIVECEPCRCLTIKSISGVAPCLFCYQFEAIEDGKTHLSREAVIHLMEGALEHGKPVVTSAVRRQLSSDLLTLKDILEDRAAVCRSAG